MSYQLLPRRCTLHYTYVEELFQHTLAAGWLGCMPWLALVALKADHPSGSQHAVMLPVVTL
jgi:hypothetical protein